jgi:predicted PurR-regulated permease PerM
MEPKLVADRIDVHPLATLAAIFIGLKLLGAWGVILGP